MEQTVKTGIASEGGHWYGVDGSPCYEIEMKTKPGEFRPVNLRDARKLNLVPSVTTITKAVLAAPGLERWKQEQILMAALTLPPVEGESLDDYARRIRDDGQEHARQAAQRGTDIHAAIESVYCGREIPKEFYAEVCGTIEAINSIHPFGAWQAEKSFAHPIGYGGKVDLHSTAAEIVVDFKTKEFSADCDKKLHWPEQAIQLAAYREGLDIPKARCFNVFVSTSEPGVVRVHEWDEADISSGWEVFRRALEIWQIQKGYVPEVTQ